MKIDKNVAKWLTSSNGWHLQIHARFHLSRHHQIRLPGKNENYFRTLFRGNNDFHKQFFYSLILPIYSSNRIGIFTYVFRHIRFFSSKNSTDDSCNIYSLSLNSWYALICFHKLVVLHLNTFLQYLHIDLLICSLLEDR